MNRHRTTHAILAIVAFLLAAHLAMRLSGNEAHAQQPPFNSAEPTVVAGEVRQLSSGTSNRVYRTWRWWSDGTVDVSVYRISTGTCDLLLPPFHVPCGPEVIIDPGP